MDGQEAADGSRVVSELTLVGRQLCPFTQRVGITLNELGVHHRVLLSDGVNPEATASLARTPFKKTPVLLWDCEVYFESDIICELLSDHHNGRLAPFDHFEKAKHRGAIRCATEVLTILARLLAAREREAVQSVQREIQTVASFVEKAWRGPYFAGEAFSLVDVAWATPLRATQVISASFQDFRLHGFASMMPVLSRPSVAAVLNGLFDDAFSAHAIKTDGVIGQSMSSCRREFDF
jgi:glutathione S-transferase